MIVLLDSYLVEPRLAGGVENCCACRFDIILGGERIELGRFEFLYVAGYLCLVWSLFYFAKKKKFPKKKLCRLLASYVLLRESTC